MKHKIRQKTLENAIKFFNELSNETDKDGTIPWGALGRVLGKYTVSRSFFYASVELGFFVKKDYGVFKKVFVHEFEPHHVRKIIDRAYETIYLKKKVTKKKSQPILEEIERYKPKEKKINIQSKKRSISLFWGLIKIG